MAKFTKRERLERAVKAAYEKAKAEKTRLAAAADAARSCSELAMEEDEEIDIGSEEECLADEEEIMVRRLSQQASQSQQQDGDVGGIDSGAGAGAVAGAVSPRASGGSGSSGDGMMAITFHVE